MIREIVRNIYFKFNYFILTILGMLLVFNGMNPLNEKVSFPLVVIVMLVEFAIVIAVEFSERETLFIKFLKRFSSLDVLFALLLLFFYVAACNRWFELL